MSALKLLHLHNVFFILTFFFLLLLFQDQIPSATVGEGGVPQYRYILPGMEVCPSAFSAGQSLAAQALTGL